MANQEHLDILEQGVEVWNRWRLEHADIIPDLSEIDLGGVNPPPRYLFSGGYFLDFRQANPKKAFAIGNNLWGADLRGADLRYANLSRSNLSWSNFSGANLSRADLSKSYLIGVSLIESNLNQASLVGVDLSGAIVGYTTFGDCDLRVVKGLETVEHAGPSTISLNTIIFSQGNIPETFLRQAGVPQAIIEQIPVLIGSLKPIDFYSCFISYSSKDEAFAKQLHADLQQEGVRCWFAPEDLNIGDKIRPRIEESQPP